MEVTFRNRNHTKYISFKGVAKEDMICCLYANNCKNIQEWYEMIEDAHINQLVIVGNSPYIFKDYLTSLKTKEGIPLFIGYE